MIEFMLSPLRKPKSHRLAEARRKFTPPIRKSYDLQWTAEEIDLLRVGQPSPMVFNFIPFDLPMTRNYDIVGRSNTF